MGSYKSVDSEGLIATGNLKRTGNLKGTVTNRLSTFAKTPTHQRNNFYLYYVNPTQLFQRSYSSILFEFQYFKRIFNSFTNLLILIDFKLQQLTMKILCLSCLFKSCIKLLFLYIINPFSCFLFYFILFIFEIVICRNLPPNSIRKLTIILNGPPYKIFHRVQLFLSSHIFACLYLYRPKKIRILYVLQFYPFPKAASGNRTEVVIWNLNINVILWYCYQQ